MAAGAALNEEGDEVYDLLYDPQQPTRAYATTRISGLWRSTDGGATWSPASSGLPAGAALRGLAADAAPGGALYVGQTGAPGRLFTSADAGSSWSPLNDDLTFTTIHAFATAPADPDVAYAGAWGGGTWKTTDGGTSWTLLPEAPVSAAALAVDPHDPQTIYATDRTEPTLWQSADGGQRWWRRFRAGDEYSRLQALTVDPHQADTVYVSAFKRGGYGADGSLFRVTRAGYADVTGALPRVAISLAVSPDQPGLLLASTHIYGLYRSTDGGQSWQAVAGGLPKVGFNAMAWEPDTGALWAGARSGSFPDYMRPPGLPNGDDEPGLYRSTNGGQTWQKRLDGVVGKGFAFTSGAIYGAAGDQVYLSTDGGQVYETCDGGQSWSAFDEGLMREGSIYAFEVDADGTRLYVSQKAGGVSRRALDPAAPQVRVVSGDGMPCTDGSHVYTSVTAALAVSHAGDRLVVCPGHYAESVSVDLAVRLESSAGPSQTCLRSIVVSGDGARVAGFRLHEITVQAGVNAELADSFDFAQDMLGAAAGPRRSLIGRHPHRGAARRL